MTASDGLKASAWSVLMSDVLAHITESCRNRAKSSRPCQMKADKSDTSDGLDICNFADVRVWTVWLRENLRCDDDKSICHSARPLCTHLRAQWPTFSHTLAKASLSTLHVQGFKSWFCGVYALIPSSMTCLHHSGYLAVRVSSPAGKFHVFLLLPSSWFAHISLAVLPDISLFWIQDLLNQGFPTVPVPSEGVQRFLRYSQFGVWVGFWIDGLISCDVRLVYLLPFIS